MQAGEPDHVGLSLVHLEVEERLWCLASGHSGSGMCMHVGGSCPPRITLKDVLGKQGWQAADNMNLIAISHPPSVAGGESYVSPLCALRVNIQLLAS